MRKFWISVFVLGLAIIALASPVLGAFPDTGHSVAPGYGAPIYAFEMARSTADLINVFGPEGDPLRSERITQMDHGNLLDFAFMATYGLFMFMFFFALWKDTDNRLWLVFASIGLLSGCADAIENLILLNLTDNLEQAPLIEWLGIPVWTKFLSIMICIAAAGFYLTTQNNNWWKILGVSSLFGSIAIFIAFLAPAEYGYIIGTGTTVGWVAMLVFSGYHSFINREQA